MEEYIRLLKRYLFLECERTSSGRIGKNGGICEYVQREFAYNSGRLEGCELSKQNVYNMYEYGVIYADKAGDVFRAKDIITVDGHFAALKYVIDNCMGYHIGISSQNAREIHRRLNCGQDMIVDRAMYELTFRTPHDLKEVAKYHVDWIKLGADIKTARVIAFIQCLNANIVPFIIHEKNKKEYENCFDDSIRLEELLKKEQICFYRETEPILVEQI